MEGEICQNHIHSSYMLWLCMADCCGGMCSGHALYCVVYYGMGRRLVGMAWPGPAAVNYVNSEAAWPARGDNIWVT